MLSGAIAKTKAGKAINKLAVHPVVLVPAEPSTRAWRRKAKRERANRAARAMKRGR